MVRVSDTIRFEVAPEQFQGLQLCVYVNDAEITDASVGIGRYPHDLLVPDNLLVATEEPRTIVIATCDCGEYGCGRMDVTIVREADTVRWTWLYEKPWVDGKPMSDDVVFDAVAYDREVERIAGDFPWETPELAAVRLVQTGVTGRRVFRVNWTSSEELEVWVANRWRVQVVETFQREGRTPEELARAVVKKLSRPE